MELREYWRIIRRRLYVVIAPFLLVLAISLLFRPAPASAFQASMRFVVGLEPEAKSGEYYAYDKYYTWLTAEYLIDDAAELVRSSSFATAVSHELDGLGITVPPGAIQGSTQSGQLHRILTVSIVWGDPDQLGAIANAVVGVLPAEIARHFAQVGTTGVSASLIDPPAMGPLGASLRDKLDLPLRLALALFAGLGLAFVLHYLDNTVHQRQEVEQAGMPVLAEIPPHSAGIGRLPRRLP
jgi:capsular polysaccharide biosynthesis protein